MSVQRKEYRVRWRRMERRETVRIFQSHSSAFRKARAILALEAIKDLTSFTTMPPLAEGPVIEARPVGGWEPVEYQITDVEDYAKESMLQHMRWTGKAEYPKDREPSLSHRAAEPFEATSRGRSERP